MYCKAYACSLREQDCVKRQITTGANVFDRYIKYGVTPVYLAKCQGGTCEQGNALRMGAIVPEITVRFDPSRDFRDQLKVQQAEPVRLWLPFSVGHGAELSIQASAHHRSVPQATHDDPRKYTHFEVFVRRDTKIAMQVQYLETTQVQRLLCDLAADFDNIQLSPLR